jgi:acyl-ACP thioesterase
MKNEFSKSHIVNSYEVDVNRKLRLDNLFMLMQDVATDAACLLGVGKDDLDKYDIAWVLSRIQIEYLKPIHENDKLVLTTWPCKPLFTFHPRCIVIYDDQGEEVLRANTIWTLLNIKERNISNVDVFEIGFPSDLETKPILPLPKKIDVSKVEYIKMYSPKYSDIDSNHHVNNTKYLTWMMDLLPLEDIINMNIVGVTTNYIHELKYNDEVQLGYVKEGNSYIFAFKKDDEVCFSAKIDIEGR